jgi:hypothetical protein
MMKPWFKRFLLVLSASLTLSGGLTFAGPLKDVSEAYVVKKVSEKIVQREIKKKVAKEALRNGELKVGKYKDLLKSRRLEEKEIGKERLEAHHMPSVKYLKGKNVPSGDGVAMEMQPQRHTQTRTYGAKNKQLLDESPRDALARDVKDAKKVYNDNGLYDEKVRKSLQEVVRSNKTLFPEVYKK